MKSIPIRSKLMFGLLGFSVLPVVLFGWFVCVQLEGARRSAVSQIQIAGQKSIEAMQNLSRQVARHKAEQVVREIEGLLGEPGGAADWIELESSGILKRIAEEQTVGGVVTVQLLVNDKPLHISGTGANPVNAVKVSGRDLTPFVADAATKSADVRAPRYTYVAAVPKSPLKVAVTVTGLALLKPIDQVTRSMRGIGGETEEQTFQMIDRLKLTLVLGVAALVVGLTLVAGQAARAITKPIGKLTAAAERISRGDHDVDLDVRGGKEIQLLAAAFRRATGELQAYARSLRAKNLELDAAYAETKRLASEDSLTGAKTRRAFDELRQMEWERYQRYKSPFCIALIDVDRLKHINDSFGHGAGDEILRGITSIVMKNSRRSDTVGRYGGDEFCVLLPETDLDGSEILMSRVHDAIAATQFPAVGNPVTVSIGIACSNGKKSADEVLASADRALYQAKRTGRSRVCGEPCADRQSNPAVSS